MRYHLEGDSFESGAFFLRFLRSVGGMMNLKAAWQVGQMGVNLQNTSTQKSISRRRKVRTKGSPDRQTEQTQPLDTSWWWQKQDGRQSTSPRLAAAHPDHSPSTPPSSVCPNSAEPRSTTLQQEPH